ncbi:MAG: hypothetical protein ACI9U6_002428 [Loktanella salsilacus]|jgi:hypothetical protein|uniref:curli-like amyloid fiber formation chaperone CsgH n=1 Tax=Loktanella salsilacus TaxID=195913 RepID=UPI003989EC45
MFDAFLALLFMTMTPAENSDGPGCAFELIRAGNAITLRGLIVSHEWPHGYYDLEILVDHSGGRSISRQSGDFTSGEGADDNVLSSSTIFISPGGRFFATLQLRDGNRKASCSIERRN